MTTPRQLAVTGLFRRATLIAAGVGLGLVLAEGLLRLAAPQDLTGSWQRQHASGLAVNRSNGSAAHHFHDIHLRYYFGPFHNRLIAAAPAPGTRHRVLVLGDSFTFGWLVPNGATIPDRLQAARPDHEFINAGVGGWGLADATAFVEFLCRDIAPAHIVLLMNGADVTRSLVSPLYRLDTRGHLVRTAPPHAPLWRSRVEELPAYDWLLEHVHLVSLARRTYVSGQLPLSGGNPLDDRARAPAPNTSEYAARLTRALLAALGRHASACGADVQVFNLGWPAPPAPDDLDPILDGAVRDGFFDARGIRFASLASSPHLDDVRADPDAFSVPDDSHPNADGAARLALAIQDAWALDTD